MEEKDIVIPQDKSSLLYSARQRVNSLFQVEVGGFNSKTKRDSGSQWINLKGSLENIEKAQRFINSLCSPRAESSFEFPSELLGSIQTKCRELEKTNCVYVSFPSNNKALIQGCDVEQLDIAIVKSELEEFVKNTSSSRFEQGGKKTETSNDKRQSSFESSSRVSQVPEPLNLDSLKDFTSKLGYTEDDLKSVISKLGQNVNKNQLLSELIKVNKSSRFLKDDRTRTNPQFYMQPQSSPSGLHGLPSPRTDIVARGPPSAVPDRGGVISRGATTAIRHDNDYASRLGVDVNEVREISGPGGDLRPIVIDGSNVAMSHGNQQIFSCRGIQICVNWFWERGHRQIFVFVPSWRKEAPNPENPISNQEILYELEQRRILKYTPARRVNGRRVICYDDRYIIKLAAEMDGIVVSNDSFRDLENESPKFKEVIEKHLLMYSFVDDYFLPPDDPLGRFGPSLDELLTKGTESLPRICPFLQKRKCTYGARCRFYHPERDGGPVKKQIDSTSKTVSEINPSSGVVSRDPGSTVARGNLLSNPSDTYPDRHPGVYQNLYPQQVIHGAMEKYESYSRPGPQFSYDYGPIYQQPQYLMPDHTKWVDNSYVVPRGHPTMGYTQPYQTYTPQGVPPQGVHQMDFIPRMQAYPPARVRHDLCVPVDMDKSRIIGQRHQQYRNLLEAFPHQEERVLTVMKQHPNELDVNNLAMKMSALP